MMMVTTTKMLGNLGLYLCIVLSVNVPRISSQTTTVYLPQTLYTVAEGSFANVSICRRPSLEDTSVQVSTDSGIALSGIDFLAISQNVTIPAGTMCISQFISIYPDFVAEGDELFTLRVAALQHQTATITITDGRTVGTVDQVNPDVTCIDDVTQMISVGSGGAMVQFTEPTATDDSDSVAILLASHRPGQYFPTGHTLVTYTFIDPSGNKGSCQFQVTVSEVSVTNMAPQTPDCPTVTLTLQPGTTAAVLNYGSITCADSEEGLITAVCNLLSGLMLPVGTYPVTCTCTDNGGLTNGCNFNVIVQESSNTDPVISSCPSVDSIIVTPVGPTQKHLQFTAPTCSDVEDGVLLVTCTPVAGSVVLNDENSITCTCTDAQQQSDSCSVSLSASIESCPQRQNISIGSQLIFTPPSCYDNSNNFVEASTCNPPSESSPSTSTVVTCQCRLQPALQCMFVVIVSQARIVPCPPTEVITSGGPVVFTPPSCYGSTGIFVGESTCTPSSGTFFQSTRVTCFCSVQPSLSCTFDVTVPQDSGSTSMPRSSTTTTPTQELGTTPSMTTTTPALNCEDDGGACGDNATCVNISSGIECICKEGFSFPGSFKPPMPSTCFDTDECETATPHECVNQAGCVNTVGSYICICPAGYYENGLKESGRQDCEVCDRSDGIDHMFGFNCSHPCTCATGAECATDTGSCTGNSCGNHPALPTCDKNELSVSVTTTPLSAEVQEGVSFKVKCSVNLLPADVSLSWTGPSGGNYTIRRLSTFLYSEELEVSSADSMDTGMYNCTATLRVPTDNITNVTGSVHITVLVQGKIVSELPKMKTGVRGSDLTLTCEAFGNPLPTVQWLFMNESASGMFINVVEMVSQDYVALKRTSRLTFNNLSKNNSGIYTCQVRMDSRETDSADVNLIVVDLPEIANLSVISSTSTSLTLIWTIKDNGSDTLTCRANYTAEGSLESKVENCIGNETCQLLGLSSYTVYDVTVECRNAAGYSNPLNASNRTDTSGPSAPRNPTVESSPEKCVVNWDHSESPNGPDLSYEVMPFIRDASSGDLDESPGRVKVESDTKYELQKADMMLNSEYTFRICANNAAHRGDCADAIGSCITNPGAPDIIPTIGTPDQKTAVNSSSVILPVPKVDDRNGPISCYEFVVMKRKAGESGSGSPDDVQFDEITSKPENDSPYRSVVMNHTEYMNKDTVTIGSDASPVTRCTLEVSSNGRRKRSNLVNGGELEATNAPLESETNYDIFMRSYSETSGGMFQYASSEFVSVTTTGGGGASPGLIVFLVILVLLIIAASIAIFVVWRKRNMPFKPDTETLPMATNVNGDNKKTEGIDNPGFEMIAEVPPINIDQLGERILEKHKHNDKLFFAEFRSLMSTNPEATIEAFNNVSNKEKNRYINIPCYDHSRVKLNKIEDDENSDYINANYVDGYSVPEKFIAAQGPKEETVEDFWRMIWEQNTKTIIMLTKCFESGRDKCFQYWPDGGEVSYGKFTVCLDSTLECPDYVIRQLRISMNKEDDDEEGADEETEKRIVTQFHFLAWPDHGVPEYPYTMLAFIKRIRQMTQNKPEKGQIVIHCSAGVGRTGTYVTIDAMLDRLKEQKTVDIFNYIQKIRLQRSTLVQSQVQYVFIYHALHEEHLYGHTEVKLNDLKQYFRRLKLKTLQDDNSPLHLEFKTAATLPVKDTGTKEASKPGNKEKNRIRNYLPYDKNRVSLERLVGDEDSTYINASYINGYERRNMYIITQAPMENTASDFWRMVWDSLTSTVVMLTDLEEKGNEMCVKFWPEEEPKTFGNLTIELADQEEEESFTIKDFTLSNNQGVSGRKVRMYQFHGWPEIGVPDCDSVTYLATVSHEYQKAAEEQESADQSKHPIIVFCHTGVGRTAIWCALSILLERAKAEGVVDVFQTVRTLRQQRQHMVQDTTQYEFLYQAVLSHLGKLDDMYENLQS